MSNATELLAAAGVEKLLEARNRMQSFFRERSDIIHGMMLAAITRHHILVIGPPGTAKSQMFNAFVRAFSFFSKDPAQYFRKLMSAALPPDELFGMPDIQVYEASGVFRRRTQGMLPESRVATFDEIFKSSDVNNNSVLDQLDEQRKFRNGDVDQDVPLEFAGGLSNEWYDDNQQAFVDRFPLKYQVAPISDKDSYFRMLQNRVDKVRGPDMEGIEIGDDEWAAVQAMAREVSVPEAAFEVLWMIHEEARKEEIYISDRTSNYAIDILQAEALLNGRMAVDAEDFAVLQHALWDDPESRDAIRSIILRVANPMLDDINQAIDAGKRALQAAREKASNLHPNATDAERLLTMADHREEIERIVNGLQAKAPQVAAGSKTEVHLRRALKRVLGYKTKLLEEVYRIDISQMAEMSAEIDEMLKGDGK